MTTGLQDWYPSLRKPWFNPPSWVFGPVWTILYIFMGVATWLILEKKYAVLDFGGEKDRRQALRFYFLQIVLNFLWTPVFFALSQPGAALLILVILLIVFVQMTTIYFQIKRATLWFLLPNILWLCFATILNLSIVLLN